MDVDFSGRKSGTVDSATREASFSDDTAYGSSKYAQAIQGGRDL